MRTMCRPWTGMAYRTSKTSENLWMFLFFYPNSWTAPKAQDGYINKFTSQKRKKKNLHDFYLYIHILCLWSALCMSNTILTVLWIHCIKRSMFVLLVSFFLYVASCECNWKPVRDFVNVMKMWKNYEKRGVLALHVGRLNSGV